MSNSHSPPRTLSTSRSFRASQSLFPPGTASSSRPFLNMLNPMGRASYQGYSQANQSLVEEEDENGIESGEEDLESGHRHGVLRKSTRSHGKQRVSWDAGASDMNILRPNIHQEDKNYEQDSSDDEVPQSFMIEATSPSRTAGRGRQQINGPSKGREAIRLQPPRPGPPLPSTVAESPLSIPLRPSEMNFEEPTPSRSSEPSERQSPKPMRGLDAYERALWNWVNVYNLDAFLQEVYYYYDGKGIYSIALARGLNLLFVFLRHTNLCVVY
jgi:autophagy-related protein 9